MPCPATPGFVSGEETKTAEKPSLSSGASMLNAWTKATAESPIFAFHKILKPIPVEYKETFTKHSLILRCLP